MNNYKEVRRIRPYDLNNLCEAKGWYTRCANDDDDWDACIDDYNYLLWTKACSDNLTTSDIVDIVEDIMAHSLFLDGETFEYISSEVINITFGWIVKKE